MDGPIASLSSHMKSILTATRPSPPLVIRSGDEEQSLVDGEKRRKQKRGATGPCRMQARPAADELYVSSGAKGRELSSAWTDKRNACRVKVQGSTKQTNMGNWRSRRPACMVRSSGWRPVKQHPRGGRRVGGQRTQRLFACLPACLVMLMWCLTPKKTNASHRIPRKRRH